MFQKTVIISQVEVRCGKTHREKNDKIVILNLLISKSKLL